MEEKSKSFLKLITSIVLPILLLGAFIILILLRIQEANGIVACISAFLAIVSVVSIGCYRNRCKKCHKWCALKEVFRQEIDRYETTERRPMREMSPLVSHSVVKMVKVTYKVTKQCKYCKEMCHVIKTDKLPN